MKFEKNIEIKVIKNTRTPPLSGDYYNNFLLKCIKN